MRPQGPENQVVDLAGAIRYSRTRWRSPAGSGGHELERLKAAASGPAPQSFQSQRILPSLWLALVMKFQTVAE
jgi:hypothetical protein